ncbi:MAG: polyprenyl synthetase family protein [Butyricicoccaceae bacterium]
MRPTQDTLARARAYGEKLGLAFQIEDDILDIEGDAANARKIHRQGRGKREIARFRLCSVWRNAESSRAELTEEAVDAVEPL